MDANLIINYFYEIELDLNYSLFNIVSKDINVYSS